MICVALLEGLIAVGRSHRVGLDAEHNFVAAAVAGGVCEADYARVPGAVDIPLRGICPRLAVLLL